MKNLVSIHILCLLLLTACATNNNQIPKSLSSSYDGIWDGYAQIPERSFYIKAEIKNGIMSGIIEDSANEKQTGFYEDRKVNGYIDSDNNLIIKPFSIWYPHPRFRNYGQPPKIVIETSYMSPDRIEGSLNVAQLEKAPKYDWFIVKPATGKSAITISNTKTGFKVNEKEPWTGTWKVESACELNGVWAMKQEGQIVKSTKHSSFEFNGKVQGNQLKGKLVYLHGLYMPFTMEIPPDGMSFNGSLDYLGGRGYFLKGKRI